MMETALQGKRILVTGSSGFIGSRLCLKLKESGAEVLTLTGKEGGRADIRDWGSVAEAGKTLQPLDIVYHLAAITYVPYALEHPRETYEVNLLGTLNILELCRLHQIEKLIFSSSYVYGLPHYLPIDEEPELRPANPYARSKTMGEDLCRAFCTDFGLKCVILRPFNIYGEGQRDDFLIPSILKQIATGTVELSDPEPKRDFLYVDDAVEAFIKAGEYKGAGCEVFNIGSGSSYSVREIVGIIVDAWGKPTDVKYKNLRRKNEIMDVVADIRKAAGKLDWRPEIGIQTGIKRYVGWYKSHQ